MRSLPKIIPAIFLPALIAWGVDTRSWISSEFSEFEKSEIRRLSLSSNGSLTLAPMMKERMDPAVPYLWAAALDSKGNLYAGGAGGKLFVLAKEKGRLLAELPGGDIYAVAINSRDEVFAAVGPDPKVYRVSAGGKSELWFCPEAKYVWSMAFDRAGNLFLATGDQGRIFKVTGQNKGSIFFDTAETHARSLVIDSAGNIVVGTDPGGLVIRVTPAGQGFVLYQTARKEVTALAAMPDGSVYAAAIGTRQSSIPPPPPSVAPVTITSGSGQPPSTASGPANRSALPSGSTPLAPISSTLGGGSELYRVNSDGSPKRVWSHPTSLVYSLGLDPQQRLLIATGNSGALFRIDSDLVWTRVLDLEPQQITAVAVAPTGIYAVTANVAKIYQIGPGSEKEGTIESESFDAGSFSYWGRLRHNSTLNGGLVRLETRSGNLESQQKHWSPWSLVESSNGARVVAPPARFLAWRATLTAAPDGKSPVLNLVETAYQARNIAPVLDRIEVTPPNYRFPATTLSLSTSTSITLPAIGQQRRTGPGSATTDSSGSQTMNYDKGSAGARWRAIDANGDTLTYKLEIRGEAEREWKPLKSELKESRYSWDGTSFPDGRYLLKVTASDEPDNYPGQALNTELVSDPFVIDNTPPSISGLIARMESGKLVLRWKATDTVTPLLSAEYSVNGGPWIYAEPTTRLTDSLQHEYGVSLEKPAGTETTIAVRAADENDNISTAKTVLR